MLTDLLQPVFIRHALTAIIILVAGAIVGFIFDRVLLAILRRAAARTKWEGDDIVISAIKGISVLWFVIGAAFIALQTIKMPERYLLISNKALVVVLIMSVTVVAARIIAGLLDLYVRKNEATTQSVSILTLVGRVIIYAVGVLIALQYLGISIAPILTALGVGGLAVALALQGVLSNLFSGMQIIASRKVKVGDFIRLETGEDGFVEDINWHNTVIRALSNNLIVVPNSKLANAVVTDYHEPSKDMSTLVQVGVSYRSNLEHVEAVTIDVARDIMRTVAGGVEDFEPFIRYHTFGDFSIQLTVILRVKEFTDQYLIKHEFVKRLHARYAKEGIEIPFPIRTIEMRQVPLKTESKQ